MRLSRRQLLAGASASMFLPRLGWADTAERLSPRALAVGDVHGKGATFWARGRAEGTLEVEYANNPEFRHAKRIHGPLASADTDFTARVSVKQRWHRDRVYWRARTGPMEEWMLGSFLPPSRGRNVRFAWGGDTCGQGWGIDEARGGLRIYDDIRQQKPDFLVHLGDLVYADNPMKSEVSLADGTTWRNLLTPEVSKVSETLDELRGRFRYNFIDDNFRACHAEVPIVNLWDDHETRNNWWPGQVFDDPRYTLREADTLSGRARQAFREYTPIGADTIYRKIAYGPLLDLFVLDTRSYRGANSAGRDKEYGPGAYWLGPVQRDWVKKELARSRAAWKIVACDMPLGIASPDGKAAWDNACNGPGEAMGRELEIADILSHLRREGVRDVAWITADLHYAAATRYEPSRAVFKDFDPFWEFLAGPLHAGTFNPHALDDTFGPRCEWVSLTERIAGANPPSEGMQWYGIVEIDAASRALTVRFHDGRGRQVHQMTVLPSPG